MLKKTLIAAALATTAVSGSAMAWTANGTGGTMEFGGTLTPPTAANPWEVMVGSAVSNLDAQVETGDTVVDIPVTTAITVLGIRTVSNQPFQGGPGISPQINFNGAVDTGAFVDNVTTLTLDVKNDADAKIGELTAPFSAVAIHSSLTGSAQTALFAPEQGKAFFGGLSSNEGGIGSVAAKNMLNNLNPEILANYNDQGKSENPGGRYVTDFSNSLYFYSAAYGSGIESGKNIKLTLDAPAASDTIAWKASLPVTVSYQ